MAKKKTTKRAKKATKNATAPKATGPDSGRGTCRSIQGTWPGRWRSTRRIPLSRGVAGSACALPCRIRCSCDVQDIGIAFHAVFLIVRQAGRAALYGVVGVVCG